MLCVLSSLLGQIHRPCAARYGVGCPLRLRLRRRRGGVPRVGARCQRNKLRGGAPIDVVGCGLRLLRWGLRRVAGGSGFRLGILGISFGRRWFPRSLLRGGSIVVC